MGEAPGASRKAEAGPGLTGESLAERGADVHSFSSPEATLEEIAGALSPERLQPYLGAAGGDGERALRLSLWNTAASAAFSGPLPGLEVVLRNAIHRQLSGRSGSAWYTNLDTGLDRGARGRIRQAMADLTRAGSPNDVPLIRAPLSFGFWVSLLGSGGRLEGVRMDRGVGRPVAAVVLSAVERAYLERQVRRHRIARALADRCRMILRCAAGVPNQVVATELGVHEHTVGKWRRRFVQERGAGLGDEPRHGFSSSVRPATARWPAAVPPLFPPPLTEAP